MDTLKEESSQHSETISVFGNESYSLPPSDEYLTEQRRLALQRVAQKRLEEDRLIAERLKREEEEKALYKKLMEEKAEKLKQLTAKRVAEYKVSPHLPHLPDLSTFVIR